MRVSVSLLSRSARFRCCLLSSVFVFYALVLTGCGGESRPPLFPASGTVRFDGKPLAHAMVVFHPKSANSNFSKPRAKTAEDGSFQIETFDSKDGLPAGDYDVTVECWLSMKGSDAPPANVLPGKYAVAQSAGLKVSIRPEPNVLPAFELKK